jgi:hypothetical protein
LNEPARYAVDVEESALIVSLLPLILGDVVMFSPEAFWTARSALVIVDPEGPVTENVVLLWTLMFLNV